MGAPLDKISFVYSIGSHDADQDGPKPLQFAIQLGHQGGSFCFEAGNV